MAQTVLHMVGNGTGGTENAVANIDIPDDGTIEGVHHIVIGDTDADNEQVVSEFSFIATTQYATNDARGVISVMAVRCGLLTSGAVQGALANYVPMDIDVSGGERVYLHSVASASVTSTHILDIYFTPTRGLPRRARRRT